MASCPQRIPRTHAADLGNNPTAQHWTIPRTRGHPTSGTTPPAQHRTILTQDHRRTRPSCCQRTWNPRGATPSYEDITRKLMSFDRHCMFGNYAASIRPFTNRRRRELGVQFLVLA